MAFDALKFEVMSKSTSERTHYSCDGADACVLTDLASAGAFFAGNWLFLGVASGRFRKLYARCRANLQGQQQVDLARWQLLQERWSVRASVAFRVSAQSCLSISFVGTWLLAGRRRKTTILAARQAQPPGECR